MKKAWLLVVCLSIIGCSEKSQLVEMDFTNYGSYGDSYITFIDIASIRSSGWNKKEVTMVHRYLSKKSTSYRLEADCGKQIMRLSYDPSIPTYKSDWTLANKNLKDSNIYSLICKEN